MFLTHLATNSTSDERSSIYARQVKFTHLLSLPTCRGESLHSNNINVHSSVDRYLDEYGRFAD
jgi:hypothetical protein